ncbi:MAG: sugar phosphate isomerase/epimerase family protein [Pseudomonadota bacterium]
MKLGVICDGISRDLKHTLGVMDEFGLEYAELQFVGEKEVGDHSRDEIAEIKALLEGHGKPVSCLSRHVFAGMTTANKPGDELHTKHMDALKRVMEMAHIVGSPLVRIMTNKKEQILWGKGGAEKWNVAKGAWDATLPLIAPAVELAKKEGLTLVVETGNGTMVNSSYTGRKLIDDLDAKGTLKVLWDPANNCWCHELAYPDGYEELRGGYLGHVHIKDVKVDTPRATLEVRRMGEGQLADLFQPMADAMRADNYDGVISFESVYHPGNGDFEAGFRECIESFKKTFG